MRNTGVAWRAGSVRRLEKGFALSLAPNPEGAALQSGSTPDSSPYTGEPGSAAKGGGKGEKFFRKN